MNYSIGVTHKIYSCNKYEKSQRCISAFMTDELVVFLTGKQRHTLNTAMYMLMLVIWRLIFTSWVKQTQPSILYFSVTLQTQ